MGKLQIDKEYQPAAVETVQVSALATSSRKSSHVSTGQMESGSCFQVPVHVRAVQATREHRARRLPGTLLHNCFPSLCGSINGT